tara:strand:- start:320 stop:664 length:345 start_codon:yes stop_codon:yes gene_type:complete
MNEMLESFLKSAKDEEKGLNVGNLMTDDEQLQWEILVKAMDSIDIMHIGDCLEKISKTYQLQKWQEMSLLAYVKVLEIMVKAAKEAASDMEMVIPRPDKPQTEVKPTYTGSMFG